MILTEHNFLVQFWVRQIKVNGYNREDIPNIFNLKEVVIKVLDKK